MSKTVHYAAKLDEQSLLELVNRCLDEKEDNEGFDEFVLVGSGGGSQQRRLRPKTDKELVESLISADKRFRGKGETEGLYGIDSLEDCQTLEHDGSVVAIRSSCAPERLNPQRRHRHGGKLLKYTAAVESNEMFVRRAYGPKGGGLQCLEGFELLRDGKGFIVAGGAVARILGDPDPREDASDLDLFLVGVADEDAACQEIHRLAGHLKEQHGHLRVYRTERCITFGIGKKFERRPPVQVILRLNQTVSEVLHGFDLGSSAVGFDGTQVWFTQLALFAYRTRLNVLDLTRRRPSYEYRIHKYFYKGFGFILPDMDDDTIMRSADLQMPRITFELLMTETGEHRARYVAAGCALPGDQNDARGTASMYERSKLYHYSDEYMAYLSCKAARREPVAVGGLCAQARYTPGMDFASIVVDLAPVGQYFWNVVTSSKKKEAKLRILSAVLGQQGAERLLDKSFSADVPNFGRLGKSLADAMGERAKIPFTFRGYWGDLEATGAKGAPPLSERDWYGAYYKNDPAADSPVATDGPAADGAEEECAT